MRLLAALVALTLAAPASARQVAGVDVADTVTVGGKALALNGAGLRKKLWIEVYVGALYLEKKAADVAAILAADGPWQVTMVFKRDVEKAKILEAFKEGFENNSKADLPQILPGLAKIDAITKDLKKGDVLVIAYAPGVGATVTVPGGASVTVEGKPFGDALLRNWLGDKPADAGLKKGMLGSER
jgi:hypothetical protein